jgi:cytochrome bd-type quinol oxidase subunit 1
MAMTELTSLVVFAKNFSTLWSSYLSAVTFGLPFYLNLLKTLFYASTFLGAHV